MVTMSDKWGLENVDWRRKTAKMIHVVLLANYALERKGRGFALRKKQLIDSLTVADIDASC